MQFSFSFDYSLSAFITNLISVCNTHTRQDIRDSIFCLFELLSNMHLNYYQLLSLFSALDDISIDEVRLMIKLSPVPNRIQPVSLRNVRMAIPRWTASKYHSGQIDDVIENIVYLINSNKTGLYLFNSNLNPRNRRSLNDLYLLLIDENTARWYDINRQISIQFVKNEE